jgi:hypothetical protein
MGWKEVAAELGTETTVRAIKAVKGQVSKRKYKRLISTAVAQLLELHPDIGPRKARRRAQRLTGARPSKKILRAANQLGLKEGAEGLITAAAAAGVGKVAGAVGERLRKGVRTRRPRASESLGPDRPEGADSEATTADSEPTQDAP